MWTIVWTLIGIAIVVVPMAIAAKFSGKGHLDVEHSQNHYIGEVEMFYHSPH